VSPTISAAINSTVAASASATGIDRNSLAGNFQTFLTLLTTQLKNQNPLDPLDTNQFTQQLVQFAQVEQQIGMNSSLGTLIALQQANQASAALGFLGTTVSVNGDTARLADGRASWSFTTNAPASATVTIRSATGQTAYAGTFAVAAGAQEFAWDGRGNDGTRWPDGSYTIGITAKDATGQAVAISTEVAGVVDGVDVTQQPMQLSIGNQKFTIDKIKQVRR
jgi:flagellar basal-body rod modification protein FlgD